MEKDVKQEELLKKCEQDILIRKLAIEQVLEHFFNLMKKKISRNS